MRTSQSEEREEVDALLDEQDDDVFVPNNNSSPSSAKAVENNNVISVDCREPLHPEKTTEGVLKAARLGDLHMLTELHQVRATDCRLHYWKIFNNESITCHPPLFLSNFLQNFLLMF